MDQALSDGLKILFSYGLSGVCLAAMFYFIVRQNKQTQQQHVDSLESFGKMHEESMVVQRELMKVLQLNAVANTRLADMLSDRPCLQGASALKRAEMQHIAEDGGGRVS